MLSFICQWDFHAEYGNPGFVDPRLAHSAILGPSTTAIFGVLNGLVNTIGFFREGHKVRRLCAGFYSAIPLTIVGAIIFNLLLKFDI